MAAYGRQQSIREMQDIDSRARREVRSNRLHHGGHYDRLPL